MDLSEYPELTDRERTILECTVKNFVEDASPVGSARLVKEHQLDVSSATVRNTLHTLEKKGYLDHPHTSAGRVPTEMGYRYFVNGLMEIQPLNALEHQALDRLAEIVRADLDDAVYRGAQLLAKLANMLAFVVSPKLASGTLRKIELVSLSSRRLLVVLNIENGLVKTVNVEVEHVLNRNQLDHVGSILNERLSGHRMSDISGKVQEMLADKQQHDDTGLINIFIDSADTIFDEQPVNRFHYGGVEYIALLPEFRDRERYRQIIGMLDNEKMIIHLLGDGETDRRVNVKIGTENNLQHIEACSVVTADYNIGSVSGKVGLLGPTRMNYGKMIALVDQFTHRFNQLGFSS